MNRAAASAFLVAAVAGALIWALSPLLTGHREPWDAEGAFYFAALLIAGLVSGALVPKPLWPQYPGAVTGQLAFGLLFLPTGPLILVGVAFLLVWALIFLAGAIAGSRARLLVGGRPR